MFAVAIGSVGLSLTRGGMHVWISARRGLFWSWRSRELYFDGGTLQHMC
jgi:hypothetical protein